MVHDRVRLGAMGGAMRVQRRDQQREERQQRDAGDGATATKPTMVLRSLGVLDRHIKIP
jgi:hypothetical protein